MSKTFEHWIDRGAAGREQFFGLLQTGLDLLNQGLTVFNEDLELVAWNQAFFTLLEFPVQFAHVGTPFEEFLRYNALRGEYGEGDVEAMVRDRLAAARTFTSHYTERERPNGKVIAVRGEPLPGKGFITVYTDVTGQRRFEKMLREQNQLLESRVQERTRDLQASAEAQRESENRLRVITDAIPALIAYCDSDWRYRFANLGYARWFGVTKEAIVGRTTREVVGDEVFANIEPQIRRLFSTRSPVSYEYSRERGGRTEYARSTVIPELDPSGRMLGFFVLSQDITEQRGGHSVVAAATDLGELVAGVAARLKRFLPPSIRLDVEAPGEPIWAMTDALGFESALLQVVLRARDAMAQGGTLRVKASLALVDAGEGAALGIRAGRYAKVAVGDTAGGIDPRASPRGGLGVALAEAIARGSQGALRIDCTPGLGTTVSLWLPGADGPVEHS